MLTNNEPKKVKTYLVKHGEFGQCHVNANSAEEAILAAAKKWKTPWQQIASYCDVFKGGEQMLLHLPKLRRAVF